MGPSSGSRLGSIPDWLALVGDSADGFPGAGRMGQALGVGRPRPLRNASTMSPTRSPTGTPASGSRYGVRPSWRQRLAERTRAGRAVPRISPPCGWTRRCSTRSDSLRWRGPTEEFEAVCRHFRDPAPRPSGPAATRAPGCNRRQSARGPEDVLRARRAPGCRAARRCTRPARGRAASGGTRWHGGTGRPGDGRRPLRRPARAAAAPS